MPFHVLQQLQNLSKIVYKSGTKWYPEWNLMKIELQTPPRRPKTAKDAPKTAPRWPQDAPRRLQDGPRCSRTPQDPPRRSQTAYTHPQTMILGRFVKDFDNFLVVF